MGNCLFGGLGDGEEAVIKVMKSDGGVMEFNAPVTAGNVTDEFPGHAIFPALDLLLKPFSHDHHLLPSQSYYLLPHHDDDAAASDKKLGSTFVVRSCHFRSNSESFPSITPYRMSLDSNNNNHTALKRSYTHVFSRNYYRAQKETKNKKRRRSCGVWKVKLVINPQQLLQILSQDGTTHELIESVRAVANCPNAAVSSSSSSSSSSLAFSHHRSLSSCRNASSNKDFSALDL